MTAVTLSAAGAGSLVNGNVYNYMLAPVIARFGEIQASATQAFTAVTTTAQSIKLSFSTPTGPEGSQPTHYKVYRAVGSSGLTNSSYTLLGVVDANYLDASGNIWPTTQIVDTGTALVPSDGTHAIGTAPSVYFYKNSGLHPLTSAGEQSIYLMSRDPNYIVRPYVREMQPINVYPTTASPDSLPFAFVADTTLAIRGPKYLGRLANVLGALDKNAGFGGTYSSTVSVTPSYIVD
jgi:hypothetical protein